MSGIEKFLQLLIAGGYILKAFSFSKIIKIENASDIVKAEELIRGIE
jgi:CRISPR/Cas system-associated protein endoribonuclease Cas2